MNFEETTGVFVKTKVRQLLLKLYFTYLMTVPLKKLLDILTV